jgi:hypothetical protein
MSIIQRYVHLFRKVDPALQDFHRDLDAVIDDIYTKLGSRAPVKIDSVAQLAPAQPSFAVINVIPMTGIGFKIQLINPQDVQPASMALARAKALNGQNPSLSRVTHNVQSAIDTNFNSTSNVTDHGNSEQTVWTIPASGVTLYWRFRSSFDGQNWNPWQLYSGPSGPIAVTV